MSYHNSVSKLQAFDHLARGPFDRAEWYALLEANGSRPIVVIAEGDDGAAALPMILGARGLESFHHWFSFAWRPLAAQGLGGDALLEAIARDLKRQAHYVTFECMPDEDGSASRLRQAFRNAGWITRMSHCDQNHVLAVAGRSFAAYWESRPGAMRNTLKRKAKKVDVSIATRFEPGDWDAYCAIYNKSWKTEEHDATLLERFARQESAAGRLRLGIARYEGIPVAAQFWSVEGGTAFIHKLAYDGDHRQLSAGTTLSAALFQHVIDTDGVSLVDFGTGCDGYKRDWMDTQRPRYALSCIDWRQPRGILALAGKAAGSLASGLRRG